MNKTWAFIKLSRPHFLLGGALMYAMGATSVGVTDPRSYLLGQAMVTAAQLTAHYANEYSDIDSDARAENRTLFSGGSGVLTAGDLSPRVARRAAMVTAFATVALAFIVMIESLVAGVLGISALTISWTYSVPPVRLLRTGLGEIVTSLVVTAMVPISGAVIQAGMVPETLVWAMTALFPIHLAMMLCFELPDLDSDRAAGKTVLAVRLGAATARRLIIGLLVAPSAVVAVGYITSSVGPRMLLPLAASIIPSGIVVRTLRTSQHQLLTMSAVLVLVTAAAGFALVV